MKKGIFFVTICYLFTLLVLTNAVEKEKEEVDKVIENEITNKLGEDLLQSIERKFQVDLQRSVDMVLLKIKMLLQNGTTQIQDRLEDLQGQLEEMKKSGEKEVDRCLKLNQNKSLTLAEKALHQMVVCGYALIGHDPSQAVSRVLALKDMIREEMKPINKQKPEIYNLLKVCGHEHDGLKKVIKCVISKSPIIKSAMMEVTNKLIAGIVELTKQMAHGAMHEACLIEVIKSVEEEAFEIVKEVRSCAYNNGSLVDEVNNYIKENNATVLDIDDKKTEMKDTTVDTIEDNDKIDDGKSVKEMKALIRRMLSDKDGDLDQRFKNKLMKLQKDLDGGDTNVIFNDNKNLDK